MSQKFNIVYWIKYARLWASCSSRFDLSPRPIPGASTGHKKRSLRHQNHILNRGLSEWSSFWENTFRIALRRFLFSDIFDWFVFLPIFKLPPPLPKVTLFKRGVSPTAREERVREKGACPSVRIYFVFPVALWSGLTSAALFAFTIPKRLLVRINPSQIKYPRLCVWFWRPNNVSPLLKKLMVYKKRKYLSSFGKDPFSGVPIFQPNNMPGEVRYLSRFYFKCEECPHDQEPLESLKIRTYTCFF